MRRKKSRSTNSPWALLFSSLPSSFLAGTSCHLFQICH